MIPTYGCPFCGTSADKMHCVQASLACWVECSACRARGPVAGDMGDAVKGWDRYAVVAHRVVARRYTDLEHAASELRAIVESAPLPPAPVADTYGGGMKALARLMLVEADGREELLLARCVPDALMAAVGERHPELSTWLTTPSGVMIGTAANAVLRIHGR